MSATYDADDLQAVLEEAIGAGFVLGRKLFGSPTGALMETLSYDAVMPVSPRPAWVSIDENPAVEETAAEAYDRRNGFGRHWGAAVPAPGEALAPAGDPGVPFLVAASALAFLVLVKEGRRSA